MAKHSNVSNMVLTRPATPKRLPAKLGSLLDIRWELKLQKEALEAELRRVAVEISLVEDAIFLRLGEDGDLTGVRGKLCQASISERDYPLVESWEDVFNFIKKGRGTSRFGLLQKRVSITALREFEDEGVKNIPVEIKQKKVLSLTKLK